MNKTTRVCDRCGNDVKGFPHSLFLDASIHFTLLTVLGHGPYDYFSRGVDLCGKCSKELDRWLTQPAEED